MLIFVLIVSLLVLLSVFRMHHSRQCICSAACSAFEFYIVSEVMLNAAIGNLAAV